MSKMRHTIFTASKSEKPAKFIEIADKDKLFKIIARKGNPL